MPPSFPPADLTRPETLRVALASLRAAVRHHLDHPTAPDDDLRRAMRDVAVTSHRDAIAPDTLMAHLDAILSSLVPADAVRRRRQAERLRHELATMCLRAYLELDEPATTGVARWLAHALTEARVALAERWLERIGARVALDPTHVFPTDELLDHVPLLIAGIAGYVADPRGALAPTDQVIAHARDLGALRHAQGFDALEILKEFEILGGVLFAFATQVLADASTDVRDTPAEQVMACAHRLQHAVLLVQQATATRYLEAHYIGLDAREQMLRGLQEATGAERSANTRRQRHIRLPRAVAEAVRGLRGHAAATRTQVRVARDLPDVEVPAAIVELALGAIMTALIDAASAARAAQGVVAEVAPLTLAIQGAVDVRVVDVRGGDGRGAMSRGRRGRGGMGSDGTGGDGTGGDGMGGDGMGGDGMGGDGMGRGEAREELLIGVVATARGAEAVHGLPPEVRWDAPALQAARESLTSVGARLVDGRTARGQHVGFALAHRRRASGAAAEADAPRLLGVRPDATPAC